MALTSKRCPVCHQLYPGDFRVCPRDAVELEISQSQTDDPLIERTLGDAYRILRVIGEGGMGRVYEARHVRLEGRRFAIKVMHSMYAGQAELVARFRREAETAYAIAHPNVVDVYDVHQTREGQPYIVSELLEGEDFGQLLDREIRLSEAATARIVRQVCRALGAAHDHGVVHRDMKPENVYVVGSTVAPLVKLLDFGIAKVEDPTGATRTRTGLVMGTPAYMAPEQAQGAKVDHRADIYAVGAILYRAVTGKLPYDREDPTQTLSALLTEEPKRPRTVEPQVSAAFELLIQKAMARDPAERFHSMAELEADLAVFDDSDHELVSVEDSGAIDTTGPMAADLSLEPVKAEARRLMERTSREAGRARPWIAVCGTVSALWLYSGTVQALVSAVQLMRGTTQQLTGSEAMLIAVGTLAGLITPSVLWTRHIARTAWRNSVQALVLARSLRLTVGTGVGTYGTAVLMTQFFHTVAKPGPMGPSEQLACLSLSAVAGFCAWLWARRAA